MGKEKGEGSPPSGKEAGGGRPEFFLTARRSAVYQLFIVCFCVVAKGKENYPFSLTNCSTPFPIASPNKNKKPHFSLNAHAKPLLKMPERERAMERKVVVVCGAVAFLGLLSAALGFAAEGTRIKASDVQITTTGECVYPSSRALALGLGAAVALMIAQAMINTLAGCICCKRNSQPSDTNWSKSLIHFIVTMNYKLVKIISLSESHLDVSSIFDRVDELELEEDLMAPDMHTRYCAYHHINLLNCIDQALVIREGSFNKANPLFLERQRHLNLLDVHSNLPPIKNIRRMPIG